MKKLSFLFLGIISLTACATFQQQAFDWRGQNFDNLVVKYGVPTSQYTLQDESVAYSFIKPCQYTQGQEEVVVVVNTDNTIYDISNVSRCPAPPQEIHYDYYVATAHKPEPKSKHEPKPTPAPAPKPEVKPQPAPTPTPTPTPTPAPKPEVKPQPQPAPQATPTPAPAQTQTAQANPAPAQQNTQEPAIAKNKESNNLIIKKFLEGSNKKETAKQEKREESKKDNKESGILKTKNNIFAKAETKKENSSDNKQSKTSILKVLQK